jgi:2-C-methyl-D-erythritol 2,4-cyclodiphosphate synthase
LRHQRIGYGYDVHRLEKGRKLILGGVKISDEIGCIAHSDGDVLLHAVCDAMLGALSLGDIGMHFPNTDPQYDGISSLELLKRTNQLVEKQGYAISNLDIMVILEAPKILGFREQMCQTISKTLGIDAGQVSVKATTSEGLGFVGEGKGVVSHAVVLLYPVEG